MNRADQAPEPTMEEILASIRLIITDASESAPQKEAKPVRASEAAKRSAAAAAVSRDDVFELTEELVIPEETAAPNPGAPAAPRQGKLPEAAAIEPQEHHLRAAPPASRTQPPPITRPALPARPEPFQLAPSDTQQRAAPAASRPVWSRRELPHAAPYQPPASKLTQDAIQPRTQPRNWAGDIQIPVPGEGPVSLIPPGGTRPVREAPGKAGAEAAAQTAYEAADSWDASKEAAAVAALAKRLARSAMGAMEETELESAQKIDFEHMHVEGRAEVTEKFADVIERERAAHGAPELPGLLDEVFRQDFIREAEPDEAPAHAGHAAEEAAFQAAGEASKAAAALKAGSHHRTLVAKAPAKPEPPPASAAPAPEREEIAPSLAVEAAAPQPAAAHPEKQAQPLVRAQFAGPAQPVIPAQASGALESAVREMLRPLLVQWLNENMPRILENAIREEIAMRGLGPKTES